MAFSTDEDLLRALESLDSKPAREQKMRIRAACARLLVFGFSGLAVNAHAKRLVHEGAAGVILFARNYSDPEQVARLCWDLKRLASPRKLLIMIDQEGGRVSRLGPPFSLIPTARTLGSTVDARLAKAAGWIIGRELKVVNIDMDLAPVADVDTNPKNPVIADRSFGSDPMKVGEFAAAFVTGLQQEGVAACAKHFPGHGDTLIDSHVALPHLPHPLARLEKVELPPFRRVSEAGVAAVMVAHLWTPALEGLITKEPLPSRNVGSGQITHLAPLNSPEERSGHQRQGKEYSSVQEGKAEGNSQNIPANQHMPASLSEGPLQYLRKSIGFNGVIVSDDMEMGAIIKHMPVPEAVVAAVTAGIDLVLVCHTEKEQIQALDSMEAAVLSKRLPLGRLRDALAAITALKQRFCKEFSKKETSAEAIFDVVGCKEHQNLVDEMNQAAAAKSLY